MTITSGIKVKEILLDSDALIAKVQINDASHSRAVKFFELLGQEDAHLFITSAVVAEVVTVLQRRFSDRRSAIDLFKQSMSEFLTVIPVDRELLESASRYFLSSLSKKNTIFDAINVAAMKKHNLDAIFSFDGFYEKNGLKLIEDLI